MSLQETTIDCCQCGKKAEVQSVTLWTEWFSNLPKGWLVSDAYPPAVEGLRFACSLACAQRFVEEHTQ
jgi:hypothetical protein